MSKQEATRNFNEADAAWSRELQRVFGKDAGTARYQKQGRGEPGTELRIAYEWRETARLAYEAAWQTA